MCRAAVHPGCSQQPPAQHLPAPWMEGWRGCVHSHPAPLSSCAPPKGTNSVKDWMRMTGMPAGRAAARNATIGRARARCAGGRAKSRLCRKGGRPRQAQCHPRQWHTCHRHDLGSRRIAPQAPLSPWGLGPRWQNRQLALLRPRASCVGWRWTSAIAPSCSLFSAKRSALRPTLAAFLAQEVGAESPERLGRVRTMIYSAPQFWQAPYSGDSMAAATAQQAVQPASASLHALFPCLILCIIHFTSKNSYSRTKMMVWMHLGPLKQKARSRRGRWRSQEVYGGGV